MIELLVTVAIAAILGMLAAPSIQEFIVRSRMDNAAGEFSGAVMRARNEAVSRNVCVSMCASSTAADVSPQCLASGTDWQQGWIVFWNPGCDGAITKPDAADVIVARPAASENIYLKNDDGLYLQFNARGNPSLSATQMFKLTYGAGDSDSMTLRFGKNICLDSMGRTRTIPRDKTCATYN